MQILKDVVTLILLTLLSPIVVLGFICGLVSDTFCGGIQVSEILIQWLNIEEKK